MYLLAAGCTSVEFGQFADLELLPRCQSFDCHMDAACEPQRLRVKKIAVYIFHTETNHLHLQKKYSAMFSVF